MIHSEAPPRRMEGRSSQRTNMFVAAAVYGQGETSPAKVRNLSEFGALVEASVLPSPGTEIRLCRGSLAAVGKVVWRRGGQAGVRFDSAITVADWLPNGTHRGQSGVDEIVHQVRMGVAPVIEATAPHTPAEPHPAAKDMETIASSIETIADELALDSHVLVHHGWKLQQLEVAIQKIRRIASAQASKL